MNLVLQFNLRGAWRNVLAFEADAPSLDLDLIAESAKTLLDLATTDASLRVIIHGAGDVVLLVDKFGRKDWPYGRKAA